MVNPKKISRTDRLDSIGYANCTMNEGKNKASLGERFTPIVLFYAFIIQLLSFLQKKPHEKELRTEGEKIKEKIVKHRYHIFPINGWPFSS